MDSNNNSSNYLSFILFVILGIMITSFFFGKLDSDNTQANAQPTIDTSAIDELYTKASEDKLIYDADIVSCKDDGFVIRKIVNSSGFGDYQVIVKLNSGNYEILDLNENTTHLYILGENKNPYIEFEFNNGNPNSVKRSNIYLPSSYTIETLDKTESIITNSAVYKGEAEK